MESEVPISEARAGLSDLLAEVHFGRKIVPLSQRGRARAALVPMEVAEAIDAVGGVDAALKLLGPRLDS